jgi:hypothetical protein
MDNEIKDMSIWNGIHIEFKYIKDGITIRKTDVGPSEVYRVFTIPTQHFDVESLNELTPERFEIEIERQKEYEKDVATSLKIAFEDE